jgi:ATP/maltotriose-dependent transcriptional regulator MalT
LLVPDDYHLIGSEHVYLSLGFLLEHLPPTVHLVLATRADPPLPLARLRARRRLAAVRRRYDPGNLFARNHNVRPQRTSLGNGT